MKAGIVSAPLPSYAGGRWFHPPGPGEPLADAATGDEVARIADRGPDVAAMVKHAKDAGGPAVGSLTFVQRAALLKDLGKRLMAVKDDFYELSACTGATRADS